MRQQGSNTAALALPLYLLGVSLAGCFDADGMQLRIQMTVPAPDAGCGEHGIRHDPPYGADAGASRTEAFDSVACERAQDCPAICCICERTGEPYHVQVCVSEPAGGACRSSSTYCTPGLTPTEGPMPADLWDVPCYEEVED